LPVRHQQMQIRCARGGELFQLPVEKRSAQHGDHALLARISEPCAVTAAQHRDGSSHNRQVP
jgi:hypothetical protein